jgi:AcrR family transcriptional regulator
MKKLTPKKREIQEREAMILRTARELLLTEGYHGVTMDSVAEATECPRGTLYRGFACKDDIVAALARESLERYASLMRRAAAYEGSSRERVLALGEAVELYHVLNRGDCLILRMANGPVREKASKERVAALNKTERERIQILRDILVDAVLKRDLMLREGSSVERIAFSLWALVDGSYELMENQAAGSVLGMDHPLGALHEAFNVLADGYDWRPLSSEYDYHASVGAIRKAVFPDEATEAYGDQASG